MLVAACVVTSTPSDTTPDRATAAASAATAVVADPDPAAEARLMASLAARGSLRGPVATATPPPSPTATPTPVPTPSATARPTPPAPTAAATAARAASATAFGDSVMLAAAGYLAESIPGLVIDAAVGRQPAAILEAMRARAASGGLGSLVLIQAGNNGPLTSRQFEEMMALAKGAERVVFVNLRLPRDWEAGNNEVLARGVAAYPNTMLVDWHAASLGKPHLFWDDGIHLRPVGARLYADLVLSRLEAR